MNRLVWIITENNGSNFYAKELEKRASLNGIGFAIISSVGITNYSRL